MSYDFQLFEIDPHAHLRLVLEAREEAFVTKSLDITNLHYALPTSHKLLAVKLRDHYDVLQRFNAPNGVIELNHEEYGIQVSFFDDMIALTVPYWHQGELARTVMEEVWRYLSLIESSTGYHTVDSQVGKVLDLSSDFSAVIAVYSSAVGKLDNLVAGNE